MKKYKVNYWIYQVEEGSTTIETESKQLAEKEAIKYLNEYSAGCKYQIDSIEEIIQ